MRLIYTSIVSMHLATRGNNKILRIPPPHISSSKEILPRLTRRTLYQPGKISHLFSNYTYTKSTPNLIHNHYAPSVTPTYTTHIMSSTSPTYAPRCHSWICEYTPLELRKCRSDGWKAGWWTTSGVIGLPLPTSKVNGVGRQQ